MAVLLDNQKYTAQSFFYSYWTTADRYLQFGMNTDHRRTWKFCMRCKFLCWKLNPKIMYDKFKLLESGSESIGIKTGSSGGLLWTGNEP
jgi:hypothetical protein